MEETKIVINCPLCGKEMEVDKYKTYNFQLENENLQPILDNSWMEQECLYCHQMFNISRIAIFHDMKKKTMYFYFPEGSGDKKEHVTFVEQLDIPVDYTLRIIENSYAAMKEKILILEYGLNDIACEIYKNNIRKKLLDLGSNPKDIRVVFKDGAAQAIAIFGIEEKPIIELFNDNEYRKALDIAKNIKNKYVIDENTIFHLLRDEL